jgi:hypothetical protein
MGKVEIFVYRHPFSSLMGGMFAVVHAISAAQDTYELR